MRHRGTPLRLELHRLKFHQNGKRGPLLNYPDLFPEEKQLLQEELLKDVRIKRIDFTGNMDEAVYDHIYVQVLSDWGVACPHSFYAIYVEHGTPHCSVCGCSLIFSETKDYLKTAKR